MKNNKVKQNINCLKYPLWLQDEKVAEKAINGMIWKDLEGYVYKTGYKPPVKTDAIFLLYLLMQSQQQNYAQEITLTRYQILKHCGINNNKQWYERLEDSLERWKKVSIEFIGNFYDGESYENISFGIIDSWSIHEKTKKLNIVFSSFFITMMRGKGFFKYINFNEFKKLRSPLATRLYEILLNSFEESNIWKINAMQLAEKIPMKEKYPAHIVPRIKAALNRINENIDIKFTLEVDQIEPGKTILCFIKLVAKKEFEAQKARFQKLEEKIQKQLKEERAKLVNLYIKTLSTKEKIALQEEAINMIDDVVKEALINYKEDYQMLICEAMEEVILQRLSLK